MQMKVGLKGRHNLAQGQVPIHRDAALGLLANGRTALKGRHKKRFQSQTYCSSYSTLYFLSKARSSS